MQVNVRICALATDRELERGSSKNTNAKICFYMFKILDISESF